MESYTCSQERINTINMEVLPKLIFTMESQNPMHILKNQIEIIINSFGKINIKE